MSRAIHKLKDTEVKNATKPGRLGDGGGLYLRVKASGSKSWSFVWKKGGRVTEKGHVIPNELGIGPYPVITLKAARIKAAYYRELLANGGDPKTDKKKSNEPTFKECAMMFLESMESQWRNDKHRRQWHMTLGLTEDQAYCRSILNVRVSQITTEHVLSVLKPHWNTKPETASRVRGRIERVIDFAKAKGWRVDPNPAVWRGHLNSLLPKPKKLIRGHHAAMPYSELPVFVERLASLEAIAARALEFLILTGARSGEVYKATWDEIDFENLVWIIPADRMKGNREHRVPLTTRAISILQPLYELRSSEFVFPGQRPKQSLSSSAMEMLLRRMKVKDVTIHGFRSSLKDWVGDETNFPRELIEHSLSHRVGNAVEQAYRRKDALNKRRGLLEAWESYLKTDSDSNIIKLLDMK